MNRFTRLTIGLMLIAAAIGGWACSSDDDEQTLAEYFAALDTIDDKATRDSDALFADFGPETAVDEAKDQFGKLPGIVDDATDAANDLNPPSEAQDAHDAFLSALEDFADEVRASGEAAKDADSTEAFGTAVQSDAFTAADEALTAACADLQTIAADNNIDVMLDCSEDDDESAQAAEETLREVVAAWNGKDVDALVPLFSNAGFVASFGPGEDGADGAPREEILARLPDFIGEPRLTIRTIEVDSSGDEITATVVWEAARALESKRFTFVDEGGMLKVDSETSQRLEVPEGAKSVKVDMDEFSFTLDAAGVPAGTIAFEATNSGAQPHDLTLAKIPEGIDMQELLMTEEDVPGFELIGSTGAGEPGETIALVLADPLEPGRYAMVCFVPDTDDPEGTPHAFKGMAQDFTVE